MGNDHRAIPASFFARWDPDEEDHIEDVAELRRLVKKQKAEVEAIGLKLQQTERLLGKVWSWRSEDLEYVHKLREARPLLKALMSVLED
jgi:hypothetical protein